MCSYSILENIFRMQMLNHNTCDVCHIRLGPIYIRSSHLNYSPYGYVFMVTILSYCSVLHLLSTFFHSRKYCFPDGNTVRRLPKLVGDVLCLLPRLSSDVTCLYIAEQLEEP